MDLDTQAMTTAKKQLLSIRHSITEIDDQLIALIAKRRQLSIEVADIKQTINKPLRDQEREKQLLETLVSKASSLNIDSHYITKIFTTIIEDSVRHQQQYIQAKISPTTKNNAPKTIAVLGGIGAYSHLAAKLFFKQSENDYSACDSFNEIIKKVEDGEVEYGVIPIENTTSGGITEVYDLLLRSQLHIIGEEKLAINHCLVAKKGKAIGEIRTIVAHPQAAKQCSDDLLRLTNATISLCESTAHALALVASEQNLDTAAIASEQAADLFGLAILQKNIANQSQNFTRFMVLCKNPIAVSLNVQSKTTIALSTGQQPGSLAKVLALFEDAEIPLTKLESRPIPEKPWEQLFYIDLQGNLRDPRVASTLNSLVQLCNFLKVFGSYPSENIIPTKVSSDSLASASLLRSQLAKSEKNSAFDESYHVHQASKIAIKRIAPSNGLLESVIDLAGTLIGKENFLLSAQLTKVESYQDLEEQTKQLSECGLTVLSLGDLSELLINQLEVKINQSTLSKIKNIAQQQQLTFVIEVKTISQLELVSRHKGIAKIAGENILNQSLLISAGNQNTPVILQRHASCSIETLLESAELVLSKGNQQVILSQQNIFSETTMSSLAELAELKRRTHLPIFLELKGELLELEFLTNLIQSLKLLGVNGVSLDLANKGASHDTNINSMITTEQFAMIMTKL